MTDAPASSLEENPSAERVLEGFVNLYLGSTGLWAGGVSTTVALAESGAGSTPIGRAFVRLVEGVFETEPATPASPVVDDAREGWTGRKCPKCKGHGRRMIGDDEKTCPDCGGTGEEYAALSTPTGETAAVGEERLPCDVMVAPGTIFRKGVKLSTMLAGLRLRASWPDVDHIDRAFAPALPVCVPEGYVLVPREPTEAMLAAGDKATLHSSPIYYAMLAAPPPAPASQSGAEIEQQRGWIYFNPDAGTEWSENHPVESGEVDDAEDIRPGTAEEFLKQLLPSWRDLATETARRETAEAALATEREKRERMEAALRKLRPALQGVGVEGGYIDGVIAEIDAALAPAPAGETQEGAS